MSKATTIKAPNVCRWIRRPDSIGNGVLAINGTNYKLAVADCDAYPECVSVVDLRKANGTHYRLAIDAEGVASCDCPDAIYRERMTVCKHAKALTAAFKHLEQGGES